jgi:GH25 family lysozyme M1 (1,4-beta-N-acetylmuramidase)
MNTGLTTGTTYYYKVRAYRLVGSTKIYGSYSPIVSKTPNLSTPVSVTATAASSDQIDISWGTVAGAEGYELYSALSSSGTYKLVSSVSATSYNDYGLSAGTTYYYKVKAYRLSGGDKVYGSFSTTANAMTDKANVTSVSLSKTSYTLTLGQAFQLIATVNPTDAINKSLTWVSSDETIATVDQDGNVMSVSAGTAIITVTTVDGNKTANCIINVVNEVNSPINRIDVSKWQGDINWDKVAGSGIQFAMIRASYGSSSTDPCFEQNYSGAKASGIAVGVYHYSYATTTAKAATEVKFLISKLKGKQFEYPICVDIEDSSQSTLSKKTLTDIVITYLDALTDAGYYPMIYANKTWFTTKLDDTRLAGYDHWLAQWSSSITYTGEVGIWQYSSSGTVSGIAGRVDLDTSFVDYASLIKQLKLNGF